MAKKTSEPDGWEIRSKLLHGSKHEGIFDTKDRAILAAEEHIKRENRGGYIDCEVDGVIYYNPHCTREEAEAY